MGDNGTNIIYIFNGPDTNEEHLQEVIRKYNEEYPDKLVDSGNLAQFRGYDFRDAETITIICTTFSDSENLLEFMRTTKYWMNRITVDGFSMKVDHKELDEVKEIDLAERWMSL